MEFIYKRIWKDKDKIWRGEQTNGTVDKLTESWLNMYITQLKDEVNNACAAMRDLKKPK
jgi:hypothetical protein